jgi:hypothetical protein
MKSAALLGAAAGPASVENGRRMKPGRSVQRQVSQSIAFAPLSATFHRGVIIRSSDSPSVRNRQTCRQPARKKVFL